MESKQHAQSVIAQLMGFEEVPIQQSSACKPYLGLSESYLQKSASIGLIENRLSFKMPALKVNCQKKQEPLNAFEVPDLPTAIQTIQGGKAKFKTTGKDWHSKEFDEVMEELDFEEGTSPRHLNRPDNLFLKHLRDLQFGQLHFLSGNANLVDPLSAPCSRNVEIFRKSERTIAKWKLLRSLKNLDGGSVTDFSEVESSGPKETESLIEVVTRNLTDGSEPKCINLKASRTVLTGKETSGNEAAQEDRPKILNKFELRGLNNQLSMNDICRDLSDPFACSMDGWNEESANSVKNLDSCPASGSTSEFHERGLSNKAAESFYLTSGDPNVQGNKLGKQNSSEVRASNLITEESSSFSSCSVGNDHNKQEIGVLGELKSKTGMKDLPCACSVDCHLPSSSILCSDPECGQTVQSTIGRQNEIKSGREKEDCSVACFTPISESVSVAGTENEGTLSRTVKDQEFHPVTVTCKMFVEDRYPDILDYSAKQERSTLSPGEMLVSLTGSSIDPEAPMKYRESHSASPDSVLEPAFGDEIIYNSSRRFQGVSTNLDGLRKQLQLLKSEETNSEGLGMVVSSDEESGEGSIDLSNESIKLLRISRAEDSRDFSYVVDVLDEAGFHSSEAVLGIHAWYSWEYPVNPSVFEMLEKKYGEQTSWEKSERKLLFDRVNCGLKQILQPCTDILSWEKPLRKNFNLSQSREVIEDELWRFLVSQEKEATKSLPEKALRTECRWLELRDDVDAIVCEIERCILNELAAELVSFE